MLTLDRRSFLVRSGLAVGAAALASAQRTYAARLNNAQDSPGGDWQWVRSQFGVDPNYAHFAGFYLVSHPTPVRQAIERYRSALDFNPIIYHQEHRRELEANVVAAAARYLNVPAQDIALTDSTTMGLGLTYTGLDLAAGDEIITSEHDHPSTVNSLGYAADRTGAKVIRAPIYRTSAGASVGEIVEAITSRITPATRIIALTWVHSKTGLRIPVRAIADAIKPINANREDAERILLCIDGVHGVGAVAGDPSADLGCDVFIAGTHKWVFGPRGTGVVWATEQAWQRIAPTISAFGSHDEMGSLHTPGGFHSFEHRWALAEAFAFHEQIGKQRVYDRIAAALNRQFKQGVAGMKHITLHTPMEDGLSAGINCFEVAGMSPGEAVERLFERRIIASTSPYEPTYARIAAGLLNDEEGVERALRGVAALA